MIEWDALEYVLEAGGLVCPALKECPCCGHSSTPDEVENLRPWDTPKGRIWIGECLEYTQDDKQCFSTMAWPDNLIKGTKYEG